MYKIEQKDIETISAECNVSDEIAMIALQYARGNIGVAIMDVKFNRHFIERMI